MKRNRVIIIAEAGVNHNGDLEMARQLIQVAAEAGADYVKFQTFIPERLVSPFARKAAYQLQTTAADQEDTQLGMLRKLQLPFEWHAELKELAQQLNIRFASTAFESESLSFLDTLHPDFYKIPSGEITNKPFLKEIASRGKPVILSTGMANMQEIGDALHILEDEGLLRSQITVLHCNTEYPTPYEDVNLKAIQSIRDTLHVEVGYSDHTAGIEISLAAVACGAKVIEKHFTLDKSLPGPDHSASLDPAELKALVRGIRHIEAALQGDGIKEASPSERKNKEAVRKSLHYAKNLQAGERIHREDLCVMRPATGISPMLEDEVIGQLVNQNVAAGTPVLKQHLQ